VGKGDMSISAFSRRSLLSIKALRLYDDMGLLRPERVDPSSGYRYYSAGQLDNARLISLLRKLDVPLATISQLLTLPPEEASQHLSSWWEGEEERMAWRRDLHRYIRGLLANNDALDTAPTGYVINVRDVAASTYLYVTKHVNGPELPRYISTSEEILIQRAEAYGGVCGLPTVIFHGVSDLDSDGPVDVCIPIAPGSLPVGDDLIRSEEAHTQAFITLTRPQIAFPQILQVYGALRRWINANGYVISGSPREIYLAEFETVALDEPLCHVAFPVQR
jgi:DNA-binding transcriptional MerR regulator